MKPLKLIRVHGELRRCVVNAVKGEILTGYNLFRNDVMESDGLGNLHENDNNGKIHDN